MVHFGNDTQEGIQQYLTDSAIFNPLYFVERFRTNLYVCYLRGLYTRFLYTEEELHFCFDLSGTDM